MSEGSPESLGSSDSSFINEYLSYYKWSASIPLRTYITLVFLPAVGLFVLINILLFFVQLPGGLIISLFARALSIFIPIVTLVYPYVVRSEEERSTKENFHIFITQFATLSLSNVDRIQIFQELANSDEIGVISREMDRIVVLVDTWNMSLDDACLVVSRNTPSDLLSGFLERLSYNLTAGNSLREFVHSEHDSILETYSAQYRADLDRIEVIGDTYLSLMIAATFLVIFIMIAPLLVGGSPLFFLSVVMTVYLITQILFVLIMESISPKDYIWYDGEFDSYEIRARNIITVIGVAVTVLLFFFLFLAFILSTDLNTGNALLDTNLNLGLLGAIPFQVYVWIATLPALVSGSLVLRYESRVQSKDDKFPGFIRGLGAIENLKNSSTATVLNEIKDKDFGRLTKPVNNLYIRLYSQIESDKSWKMFSAECGSYLIQRFTSMYRIGRELGANTREIGEISSSTFRTVMTLRERRDQAGGTIIGLIYGVLAVSSFAFFAALTIIDTLLTFEDRIQVANDREDLSVQIIDFSGYNVLAMEGILISTLIISAVLSAIMIKISLRKSYGVALFHFSLMILTIMAPGILIDIAAGSISAIE